jgi:hypothetical protein
MVLAVLHVLDERGEEVSVGEVRGQKGEEAGGGGR